VLSSAGISRASLEADLHPRDGLVGADGAADLAFGRQR
jgi:hypothetical protein